MPRRINRLSLPVLLKKLDPGISPVRQGDEKLEKTVGFVDSLLRYRIFQRYGKCLMRTLVLFKFLRKQGWPVDIYFGVRKDPEKNDEISGHSWLVLNGEPLLEDVNHLVNYRTTYSYQGDLD